MERITAQEQSFIACSLCMGSGQDAGAPHRRTENGSFVYLVRPCPVCEGRGVIAAHPSEGTVSGFGDSVTTYSLAPSGITDMSYGDSLAVPS